MTESKKIEHGIKILKEFQLLPEDWNKYGIHSSLDGVKRSAFDILGRGDQINLQLLAEKWPDAFRSIHSDVVAHLEAECKYSACLVRQQQEIANFKKEEENLLPKDIDYWSMPSLSNEEREKLSRVQPTTLGAAGRIPGVTPSTLMLLLKFVSKASQREKPVAEPIALQS